MVSFCFAVIGVNGIDASVVRLFGRTPKTRLSWVAWTGEAASAGAVASCAHRHEALKTKRITAVARRRGAETISSLDDVRGHMVTAMLANARGAANSCLTEVRIMS